MASPPYRSPATSPPYPSSASLPNPKKRPSLSVSSHVPNAKRRKPTNASQASTPATSHPLRQTSFPPEESAIDTHELSPSVESDVTGVTGATGQRSNITTVAGKGKPKKRGRKKKGEAVSVVSAGKQGATDAASVTGQGADEGVEEDDDDADGEDGMDGDQEKQRRLQERANLNVLMDSFNDDQRSRYEAMRRNKLRKETVRKIVNQTLSQSVPPSVVTAIGGATKLLIGNLIERARDIQEQYAAAASYPSPVSRPTSSRTAVETQSNGCSTQDTLRPSSFDSATARDDGPSSSSAEPQPETQPSSDSLPELNHNEIFGSPAASPTGGSLQISPSQLFPPQLSSFPNQPSGLKPLPKSTPSSIQQQHQNSFSNSFSASGSPGSSQALLSPVFPDSTKSKPKDLGPLLPDHFREAMRRYKRDGESTGAGLGGSSLMGLGVQGTAAATRGQGRRLFG